MNQSHNISNPSISVVMAVFNAEKYLKESIDSILNQSYKNFELLIINDASNDKTDSILSSYSDDRIVIIKNEVNKGLTKSLNIGLKHAKGDFIARQDADDVSINNRLELQLNFLKSNIDCTIVGTQCYLIDENSRPIQFPALSKPLEMGAIRRYAAVDNPFLHSSVLFRKKDVMDIGGYNEEFKTSQDFELWSRLLNKSRGANLPIKLIKFRIHKESVSSDLYKNIQNNDRLVLISKINNIMIGHIQNFIGNIELSKEWASCNQALFSHGDCEFNRKYLLVYKKGMSFLKQRQHNENLSKQDYHDINLLISNKYLLIGKRYISKGKYFLAVNAYIESLLSSPLYFISYLKWIIKYSYLFKCNKLNR